MELILLERIEKLGKMGEVVRVRPGYARNYLLPQKKAVRATAENKARFEVERAQLEALNQARREQAEGLGGTLEGMTVVLIRQAGESGQLYGSVNARDIAEAVSATGVEVYRQHVKLAQPIKAIGMHEVGISLHPEVVVPILVNVARTEQEAELQAQGSSIAQAEEEAAAAEEVGAELDHSDEEMIAESVEEGDTPPA